MKHDLTYETLKQLKPVVELENLIKMKDGIVSNSVLISQLVPRLILVVRDHQIHLEQGISGVEISEKEYFEKQV